MSSSEAGAAPASGAAPAAAAVGAERPGNAVEHCCICLSDVPQPAVLDSCAHAFCADCILAWVKRASSCPLCKRRISTVTYGGVAERVAHADQANNVWDGILTADDGEDLVDDVVCSICGSGDREDELLLCERFEACGASAHASCLGLPGVPLDDWACVACRNAATRRERASARRLAAQQRRETPVGEHEGAAGEHFLGADDLFLCSRGPSERHICDERPPSPEAGAPARERLWVARQRAITASVDAQRAHDAAAASGAAGGTHRVRHTALRTVRELRTNWQQLQSGALSFPALTPAPGTAPARTAVQPSTRRRARTLLQTAEDAGQTAEDAGFDAEAASRGGNPFTAASGAACAADAPAELGDADRSWLALARLNEQRAGAAHGSRVPRARAPATAVPAHTGADGHLAHFEYARRLRDAASGVSASRSRGLTGHLGHAASVRRARDAEGTAAKAPTASSLELHVSGLAPQAASFRIPKRTLDTPAPLEPAPKQLRALPLPPAGPSMSSVLQEPDTQIPHKREQSPASAAGTAPTDMASWHLTGLPLPHQCLSPLAAGPLSGAAGAAVTAPHQQPLRETQARATTAAAAAAEAYLRQPYRAGAISKQQYKDACRAVVRAAASQLALSWSARGASAATSTAADNEAAEARAAVMRELCVMLPNVFGVGVPSDAT